MAFPRWVAAFFFLRVLVGGDALHNGIQPVRIKEAFEHVAFEGVFVCEASRAESGEVIQ